MANPHRGEVEALVDGRRRTLRLTLGSLAALEAELGAESLVDLADRFDSGGMRARDVIAVLTAGLRGAGDDLSSDEVAGLSFEGGAAGAARLAIALLGAAFGVADA